MLDRGSSWSRGSPRRRGSPWGRGSPWSGGSPVARWVGEGHGAPIRPGPRPRTRRGKMLLPRIALGGLGAFGSPAALVGLQNSFGERDGWWRARPDAHAPPPRPGYCLQHFLGEPEDQCMWSPDVFAASGFRRRPAE